jgi:methionine aminopeptidase
VLVSPEGSAAVVSGKEADLIEAARTAFNAALRLIKPGKRVADVSPKLAACVEPFGVNLVEGVMSHIMKQVGQGQGVKSARGGRGGGGSGQFGGWVSLMQRHVEWAA